MVEPEDSDNSESPSPKPIHLSVEDILEEAGGFSWFQICAMIVIISPELVAAMIALSPVLTSSNEVLFYCDFGSEYEASVFFTANEINKLQDSVDVCLNGTLRPFGTFTSVVQEWSLVGKNAWVADLFTSVQMFGSMLGALLSSQYAEKFGRKKAHFSLCFLMGAFGFASGWAPDPYSYAATRFVAGFAVGGCFVVYMNYLMEFLTPSFRTICGCVSLWAVGEMILALMGYYWPQWRHLTWATSLPVFLIFIAYPWFPESPRWLLVRERTEEAIDVFQTIAQVNKKPELDPSRIRTIQKSIANSKTSSNDSLSVMESLKLLKIKGFRTQLLILTFSWFTSQLVYYGISFNMKHLDGNPHMNVLYMGVFDLPGSFTGILFNNKFGRKKTFIGFTLISSLILTSLVTTELIGLTITHPSLINILSLSARYFISAGFGVLSCFTAESFPTVGRVWCMGICALFGNIGGILAPQFSFLGTIFRSSHFISFAVLTILTVFTAFKLRDRTGKPLQDMGMESDTE